MKRNGLLLSIFVYSHILSANVIISETESYDDYVLRWSEIKNIQSDDLYSLPTICGEVNRLHIQVTHEERPRVVIDNGWVKELQSDHAMVVLQNEGRIGLGTVRRSMQAPILLGENGITIFANGNGEIILNADLVINTVCTIIKGPEFSSGNQLHVTAQEPHELRITKNGILDLRQFGVGDSIEFSGYVRLIAEPGAKIIIGGCSVRFVDETCLVAESFEKTLQAFETLLHGKHSTALDPLQATPASYAHNPYASLMYFGAGLQITDDFRVKLIGTGTIEFAADANFFIPEDAFVGIQTLSDPYEITTTDITIVLRDNAQLLLGDQGSRGGVLQIGNTIDQIEHSIWCTLSLQGKNARLVVKEGAFLGFGVGIADKRSPFPNDWIVGTTFNVEGMHILIGDGIFEHNRIFAGDDSNASLIAFAKYTKAKPLYTLHIEDMPTNDLYKETTANILGGGNIVIIAHQSNQLLHPVVTNYDNQIVIGNNNTHPNMRAGVLASRSLIACKNQRHVGPDDFFDGVKIKDYQQPGKSLGKATVAFKDSSVRHTILRAAFVDRERIGRNDIYDIDDAECMFKEERQQQAAKLGAVSIHVALSGVSPARILFAQQLPE